MSAATAYPGGAIRRGFATLLPADTTVAKTLTNFAPGASGTLIDTMRCVSSGSASPGAATAGTTQVEIIASGSADTVIHTFTWTAVSRVVQDIQLPSGLYLLSGETLKVRVTQTLAASSQFDFNFTGRDY